MTIPGTEQDSDSDPSHRRPRRRHRARSASSTNGTGPRRAAIGVRAGPRPGRRGGPGRPEAFRVKVFASLRAGRGPLVAFRAYLHTTMRHVCYHRARRDRRLEFTDDLSRYDEGQPFTDPALDRLERAYAAARLPQTAAALAGRPLADRDRGQHPGRGGGRTRDDATPNAVAVLAHRAREGLRSLWRHVAVGENTRNAAGPAYGWAASCGAGSPRRTPTG